MEIKSPGLSEVTTPLHLEVQGDISFQDYALVTPSHSCAHYELLRISALHSKLSMLTVSFSLPSGHISCPCEGASGL